MALQHADLTEKIINVFYTVYNRLGHGFLEKVYENAMILELTKRGFSVEQQKQIKVYYEGRIVGDYYADLLVNGLVVLELKAAEAISEAHTAQLVNYLRATTCEIGFVFNFGPEPDFERRYFSNAHKRHLKKNP
ncbi:GxxExxY protein [bacterium]|nr:GxxExxY protein [bacterium]